MRAANIGCYLDRIDNFYDNFYKLYAEVFLKEESKGLDGEHIRNLHDDKGDTGITIFLFPAIKIFAADR